MTWQKGGPTEEKMQKGVDQVSDSCDSYDLTIRIKKTEVVYQPAPGKPYKEPTITVKGQRLQDNWYMMNICQKKIFYGELKIGKCSHGGQKKRYKTLKVFLKDFSILTGSWEQIAQDRAKWRGLIRWNADEYEAKTISKAGQKHAQRNARAKASPAELSSSDLSCSICNRQFRAKIGLTAILEYLNSNTSSIWLGLVTVSNGRRTINMRKKNIYIKVELT